MFWDHSWVYHWRTSTDSDWHIVPYPSEMAYLCRGPWHSPHFPQLSALSVAATAAAAQADRSLSCCTKNFFSGLFVFFCRTQMSPSTIGTQLNPSLRQSSTQVPIKSESEQLYAKYEYEYWVNLIQAFHDGILSYAAAIRKGSEANRLFYKKYILVKCITYSLFIYDYILWYLLDSYMHEFISG